MSSTFRDGPHVNKSKGLRTVPRISCIDRGEMYTGELALVSQAPSALPLPWHILEHKR